jgi:flagellar biosynthesis protein FliR
MEDALFAPYYFLEHLDVVWSFMLLVVRYIALLLTLPGVGLGMQGLLIRTPAAMVMAFASLNPEGYAAMPEDWILMFGGVVSEVLFGCVLGLVPLMIVAGVQTGASIASTTMGLTASNLIDPTSGGQIPDLARLFGDFTVVIFLALGGHYVCLYAASGLGLHFVPGSLFTAQNTVQLFIDKSADIFRLGVMVSAPVVVALLLTQFVMGLLSKAVPSVNIFIVSFPLTIGIGLILSVLVLPELTTVVKNEVRRMESTVVLITEDREVRSVTKTTLPPLRSL